jgi:probable HAF family extracellular repeat protein
MKNRTTIVMFALLSLTTSTALRLVAQEQTTKLYHYELIDIGGTLGGPSSYLAGSNGVNDAVNRVLNNQGTVVGWGDTSTHDPFDPNCFNPFGQDCFLPVAFKWQKGVLTGLAPLPGSASTAAWISDTGLIAGQARNGSVDPLLPGIAEIRAILWKDGEVIDLGTLGGNESSAFSVNNRGQVVGVAVNTIPDPFSFFATQLRAFFWQDGAMQDLGTLGGPEAWALFVNENGQVAGFSLTNDTVNPATGYPTQDPFLWEKGTMLDLGTLGGTFGWPYGLNNRGQVVGESDLAGDLTYHPFLWDRGALIDLGTFGGSFGIAEGINDSGEVVGWATNENNQYLAFLWKDGVMTNLGTVNGDDCSLAFHINSKGQIVGISFPCASGPGPDTHGFLWQNGIMTDLSVFAPPGSTLTFWGDGAFINDRGEIAGVRVLPDGDLHAFQLLPCDENHPNVEGCNYTLLDASATANTGVSDPPYAMPNTSNTSIIEPLKRKGGGGSGGGRCTPEGMECPPIFPPCCLGLTCVPESTRAFCLRL